MSNIGSKVSFKVANNDNTSILGSDSKERVGEWYTLDIGYKISEPFHQRTKRLVDIVLAILFCFFFPMVLLFSKQSLHIFKNVWTVIWGQKTWVGYSQLDDKLNELPNIKEGVFEVFNGPEADMKEHHQANLWYARNYSTGAEVVTIINKCRQK